MEKKNTLFKNTIYKSILSFVNIVVPIIIGPYITRLLDAELYGTYNSVLADFQMFLAFASFGVYNFGVREISKIRKDKKKISQLFTNLFIISVISNILVLLIYLCFVFLTSSGISTTLYLIMIIQILANIVYVEFVNEALENYKFITIKSVIVKLIYFITLLLFVKKPTDVIPYAVIVCLTIFLNNIISFIYAKNKIKFDISQINFKKYIKPLLAVLIITNVDLLYSQLDKVMLGKYVSKISVTLYFIPYYIVSTLVSIPYAIIYVSIPRLSYIIKNEGIEKYEEKLNNSISSLFFVIVPICFGVLAIANEIIYLYSGDKYQSATIPLIIACVMRIFVCMESIMNNLVLYPNNKENRILKVSLLCGILNAILNYLLVIFNILNPSTAMLTTGVCEIIVFVIHYIYTRKTMKIKVEIFSKQNLLYIFLGCLFIPISYLVRKIELPFVITLGLIITMCFLLYTTVLFIKKDNSLMFVINKFRKKKG